MHRLSLKRLLSPNCVRCTKFQYQSSVSKLPRWTQEQVNEWYKNQGWLVGPNYIPSTAVNQLEMWHKETFDVDTITRELGFAKKIGINTARVFLHHLAWSEDKVGFLERLDQFLSISAKYKIRPILVLLDDCWNPLPKVGKQEAPVPHVYNSRWVQCPGREGLANVNYQNKVIKAYITSIVSRFADDQRILMWDLYNKPGKNTNTELYNDPFWKPVESQALLDKTFRWIREINPSQPLTSPIWSRLSLDNPTPIQNTQIHNCDVMTFHNYESLPFFKQVYKIIKQLHRPVICTEFMARQTGSTFQEILPYAMNNTIGALNWGWVSGKTQTIYHWDSWQKKYTEPPEIWCHDILHKDGKPFDRKETELITRLLGKGYQRY